MSAKKLPIPQAVAFKYPGAKCSKNKAGDGIDTWVPPADQPDLPKPNQIQLVRMLDEYDAYLKATAYVRARRSEYPPVEDALDALVHKELGNPGPWSDYVARCRSVKEKHPKP